MTRARDICCIPVVHVTVVAEARVSYARGTGREKNAGWECLAGCWLPNAGLSPGHPATHRPFTRGRRCVGGLGRSTNFFTRSPGLPYPTATQRSSAWHLTAHKNHVMSRQQVSHKACGLQRGFKGWGWMYSKRPNRSLHMFHLRPA